MTDDNVIPFDRKRNIVASSKDDKVIDTLTSFVRDTEHEIFAVVTALQAHIDLLHLEQLKSNLPVDRLEVLHRGVARIVSDTSNLASIAELATTKLPATQISMYKLMQELLFETKSDFDKCRVEISCNIAKSAILAGNASSIRLMFKAMLMAILANCQNKESLKIIGSVRKTQLSFTFELGKTGTERLFEPWRLGELRLIPTNVHGIELSAIDAMARMHKGWLSMCMQSGEHKGYRLTFNS